MNNGGEFAFQAIGITRSCYGEKFGTPRQPNLVSTATAVVELLAPYDNPQAIEGLDEFSHLWLIFCFHQHLNKQWQPKVRPPRLGGNNRVGVFASRSSFRPNPIGLSVVKLDRIDTSNAKVQLHVSGQDIIDGTPILDIKPYLGYADSIPYAKSGYAQDQPKALLEVIFTKQAQNALTAHIEKYPSIEQLITQTVALDPRPSYHSQKNVNSHYGMKILDFDVKFSVDNNKAIIEEIG